MLLVPVLGAAFLAGIALPSEVPRLRPAVRLLAGGQPFHVDSAHAAPYMYDYDKDGRKDLLVGQFGEGKCRIYLNQGTDAAPAFGDFRWLMAAGEPARTDPG